MAFRSPQEEIPNVFVAHDQLLGKRLRFSADDKKLFVKTKVNETPRLVHEFPQRITRIGGEFSYEDTSFFTVSIEASASGLDMHNICVMRMHSRGQIEQNDDKTATLVLQSWGLFQGVCVEMCLDDNYISMLPSIGPARREECMNFMNFLRELLRNPNQKIESHISPPPSEMQKQIERKRRFPMRDRLRSVPA